MAPEEPSAAFLEVYVFHRGSDSERGAGVFCELGIAGLEEDFDAIERRHCRFGLSVMWLAKSIPAHLD